MDLVNTLEMWFEATDILHTYKLAYSRWKPRKNLPEFVAFSSSDPALALPSPGLLALHATCAKVAHLSGAAEHVNRVLVEDTRFLARDGGSGDVLDMILASRIGELTRVHSIQARVHIQRLAVPLPPAELFVSTFSAKPSTDLTKWVATRQNSLPNILQSVSF